MKAVFYKSDWPEVFDEEILVTYVRKDELDSDAVLRAIELCGANYEYYIREFGTDK